MAIAFVGIADAAAASVALPAFTAGDVAYVFAFRDGSQVTAPSLPAGWTNIANQGANTCSFRSGYRVLQGGDTTTGTWTNATEIVVIVLSGVDNGNPVGAVAAAQGASTSMNFATLGTFAKTDGSSWVVLMGGHRTATDVNSTALTGTTNRSPGTGAVAGHTDESVSSWSATAKTVDANSGWETIAIEAVESGLSDRMSQEPVEAVISPDAGKARVSQEAVESVMSPTVGMARTSQLVVESVATYANVAVTSQLVVEVVREFIPPVTAPPFQAYIID